MNYIVLAVLWIIVILFLLFSYKIRDYIYPNRSSESYDGMWIQALAGLGLIIMPFTTIMNIGKDSNGMF